MSRAAFEQKLGELRSMGEPAALRKALRDRNNFYVSKAAARVAELQLVELIPDLEASFYRFFENPGKPDPQCWAKNAIAKALKDLGHRGPAPYLRGIVHLQPEASWGPPVDTAATLRGTCALALVDTTLDDIEVLTHLTERLADPEKTVRLDAAAAVAQVNRPEGLLLLRLKVLVGDAEPEVLGQCLLALPAEFVARFLDAADPDVQVEAVGALAQSREPVSIGILEKFWRRVLTPQMRRTFLLSLGASPLKEAAEFLRRVAAEESGEVAATAKAALENSRFGKEVRD